MTLADLTDPASVLQAMALYDELGQDHFLSRFGYGPSRRYVLMHRSRSYDSKAIAGVAHGFQFPGSGPLRSTEFSGGLGGAATKLIGLGFELHDQDPHGHGVDILDTNEAVPPAAVDAETIALVGCVKGKRATATEAQDLYTSDLFKKRRDHVTRRGLEWLILSAQHGLVAREQVIDPYDMALKDQSASYQREWGLRVVDQLDSLLGTVVGRTFEVHAGAAYVNALQAPLRAERAIILAPLKGLAQGEQLAWYLQYVPGDHQVSPEADLDPLRVLGDRQLAQRCADFPWNRDDLAQAGLYSWWVDESGAKDLSRGLGLRLEPGLIYIGQTGASSRHLGKASSGTLRSRIGQHLNGGAKASTWRKTLAALLIREGPVDEHLVSTWMRDHLQLIVCVATQSSEILDIERRALQQFDPPLNLEGVKRSGTRIALSALRSDLASRPL